MGTRKQIRVTFQLEPDTWHGTSSEGIWTRLVMLLPDMTNVKAIVEVDNIPFFSKIASLGDKILADFNHGIPMFDSVVEHGGHSTCRIFIEKPQIGVVDIIGQLRTIGCGY